MNNKRVLITGANSGMGKALSLRMAKEGYHVIMLCRDPERGKKAFEEVTSLSGSSEVHLEICDLASLESIRTFSERLHKLYDHLDILVNNAGVILPGRHVTKDGFELQFGVNHLGHFALTLQLLPLIMKSADPRIIIVSSGAHIIGKLYFDDIHLEKNFTTIRAYSRSKLANILFCYELADRVKDRGIKVNSLHPGAVGTNMGINRDTGFGKGIMGLLRPFFKTPEEGADTAYYLATSREIKDNTGKYFVKRKIKSSSFRSRDSELASRLWELSEEMTGIHFSSIPMGK
jgi:NAD(P)-dependent dehydrogenase (short-subunit alcohol dehydrogenase family)